jgi:hypothetical protein
MNSNAAISNVASVGISLCRSLRIICVTDKQFTEANFETHIVGLAFVRFFLTDTDRITKYPMIIDRVENTYFLTLSHPPAFLKLALLGSKYQRNQDARYRSAYEKRKDSYYKLFSECLKYNLDSAEDFFRTSVNGPGLELHKAILSNVFSSSSGLHRPTHEELIQISQDSLHQALFAYGFLDRNWEDLVMDR